MRTTATRLVVRVIKMNETVHEWVCSNCGAGYPTVEKEGDVRVEEIGPADPFNDGEKLRMYRELSGFETVLDWQKAIQALNGDLDSDYLYRATVQNDDI